MKFGDNIYDAVHNSRKIQRRKSMLKMELQPVEVPWMISPSHDFSCFTGIENREVKVQVMVGYNNQYFEKVMSRLNEVYGEDIPDKEYNRAGNGMIEIKFTPICVFNIYGKVEGYEKYDFSKVNKYYTGEASLSHEWDTTNICPDPGFYEIKKSTIKENYGYNSSKVKHWVLCGHDSCIDILAYSFEWRTLEW